MIRLPRRPSFKTTVVAAAVATVVLWLSTPYDSPLLLAPRFWSFRLFSAVDTPFASDDWLYQPARFPIQTDHDVALVVKTGYGTRARVPALLDALGLTSNDRMLEDLLVVADYNSNITHDGKTIWIHDVITQVVQHEALRSFRDSGKLQKYKNMVSVIEAGDEAKISQVVKETGWELDALKFIPGLDLAYRKMPDKQWYVMIDDDTFIFKPSLVLLLQQLDPSKAQYIGNALGDYKGRFAHGGSAVILSRAAIRRLFEDKRHLIPAAYIESLDMTWGDKLVATTFMKTGTYLDERYSRFFNGESPRMSRVLGDRVCSPVMSFHGLGDPAQMKEVGHVFRFVTRPVTWGQLWTMYDQPAFDVFLQDPLRLGHDHVGRTDEFTSTTQGVESAEKCASLCDRRGSKCLAWTWDKKSKACNTSPWYIVGDQPPEKYSGLDVVRVKKLGSKCRKP